MNTLHARLSGSAAGRLLITTIRILVDLAVALPGFVLLLPAALLARVQGNPGAAGKPRLLFGAQPIKSLTYSVSALREAGYTARTVVTDRYPTASDSDFDVVLHERYRGNILLQHLADTVSQVLYFARALFHFDVFHYFFDGGLLRRTLLADLELPLLKLAGKKIVLFPYGSDAFVYDELDDLSWRHALLVNNAVHADRAGRIQRRLRRSSALADAVVGAIAHIDNLPRWDVLPVVWYPFDMGSVESHPPSTSGPIRLCHAPNHRGAKGTEFLLAAVESLRGDGVDIELDLVEGVPNAEVLQRMASADIVIDQLLVGYALTAIEAMALGKVVVSGLEGDRYQLFRRYSYLDECPIVPASPESIEAVLRDLVDRRESWPELGRNSRAYAENRHSYAASAAMWDAIYQRIWHGAEVDLINLYNPLLAQRKPNG